MFVISASLLYTTSNADGTYMITMLLAPSLTTYMVHFSISVFLATVLSQTTSLLRNTALKRPVFGSMA